MTSHADTFETFVQAAPRFLFFTGKGGVGKTTLSCATAVALADRGRRVLLISTDPASNLNEVLGAELTSTPLRIESVPTLWALNIDPETAAHEYREHVVAPYRGTLPPAMVASIEEQLSGACTTEIAAFNEFSRFLGQPEATADYDHIVFDTAPTGHTLRLLQLPAATLLLLDATEAYHREVSRTQSDLPEAVRQLLPRLRDPEFSKTILVTLPEATPVHEASQLQDDLKRAGIEPFAWVINQSLSPLKLDHALLRARQDNERRFIEEVRQLAGRFAVAPWLAHEPMGVEGLRQLTAEPSAASSGHAKQEVHNATV